MADGWIKLHRKSIESRVFSDAALWRLWTWCLLRANHATGFFQGEEILPGSFATGTRVAGETLGLAPTTVHRGLKRLAEWNMVSLKVKRGYTVVTICNYATYQDSESATETQMKRSRNANETLVEQPCSVEETLATPNKNNNNNKNLPPSPPLAAGSWEEAGDDLRKLGMSRVDDAIAMAKTRGLTTDDVCKLIGEWQANAGAWGHGALFQRLTGQLATWPPVDPKFAATKAREATTKAHVTVVTERLAGEKRREDDRRARESRERLHGGTLDAMKRSQVVGIIRENFADSAEIMIQRLPARGRITGMVRDELLCHLQAGEAVL